MLFLAIRPTLQGALALLLVACSSPEETTQTPPGEEPARQFSAAERAAAQALSIGNRGTMPEAASPYEQALACSQAIESITERFRQSGALTEQQMQAVDQAKALYDRRAQLLASQADRSADESPTDPRDAAQDSPAPREQALLAMGCLQELDATG